MLCVFKVGEEEVHSIEVFSSFLGKDIVRVDGVDVINKRSFWLTQNMQFDVGNKEKHSVELKYNALTMTSKAFVDKSLYINRLFPQVIYYNIVLIIFTLAPVLHMMYGHCQSSKLHYMIQQYYMPVCFPKWMQKNIDKDKEGYTGKWTVWYTSGAKLGEYIYSDGKKNGKGTSWYKSGAKKAEEECIDDKMNGLVIFWYESGVKESEFECKDGKIDGVSKSYFENGNLKYYNEYKNGEVDGVTRQYYKNGILALKCFHKKGKLNGQLKSYYESGAIKSECELKDDKKDGKETSWYKDGVKSAEYEFEDDNQNGKYTEWDETGKKIKEQEFKSGVMIKDYLTTK